MTIDPESPARLSQSADPAARELVGSARLDVPSAGSREASIEQVLGRFRQQRAQRRVAWLAAGSAVALAAAFALWVRANHAPATPLAREVPPAPVTIASGATPPAPSAGSPELEACTPAVVAEGKAPLIDDFEDANTRIAALEHRAGFWSESNDSTGVQQPTLGIPFVMSRIPGGRGDSRFALHTSGSKFSKWGAVVSTEFSTRRCYDASAYAGLGFWSRGRGSMNIVAKMTQISPEEYGGTCTHDCFDGHKATIALSSKWQEHRVPWSELKQKGFGQPVPFDPHSLLSLELSVSPDQTPFDFWVDDIRFLER